MTEQKENDSPIDSTDTVSDAFDIKIGKYVKNSAVTTRLIGAQITECLGKQVGDPNDDATYLDSPKIEDLVLEDKPWIMNDTLDQINVYADVEDALVDFEGRNLYSEVTTLKVNADAKNTWIWDYLSKLGMLTAIWAQTDRFGIFWKGATVQKWLFKNPEPAIVALGFGPHATQQAYDQLDLGTAALQAWNDSGDTQVAYLASWVPTFHQQVFN